MKNSYSLEDKMFLEKIGTRIKELRSEYHFSQEKLAFACGLDRTYIGSIERGERNVSIINLNKIANSIGISLSELLNF